MPYSGKLDTAGFNHPYGFGVFYSEGPQGLDPDSDHGTAVAIQPDGKIVVAGFTFPLAGSNCFLVFRFNVDGTPDPAFGSQGFAIADFQANDRAFAVALQRDGKIVLAGFTNRKTPQDFAVARFLDNGDLDLGFGDGGMAITNFGLGSLSQANGVAIQRDGRIVAVGYMYPPPAPMLPPRFALARYLPDGSLDHTFGQAGLVTTEFGGASKGNAVVIQRDDRIVVAGTAQHRFALAGYLPQNGSLDKGFGTQGRVTITMGGPGAFATSIATSATGRLAVGGGGGERQGSMAIARCHEDGSLDQGFGAAGRVYAHFAGGAAASHANGVALVYDDAVVAAGQACTSSSPLYDQAVAEFDPHGVLVPFLTNPPNVWPGVTKIGPPPPAAWMPPWPWGPALGLAVSAQHGAVTVGWADDGSGIYQGVSVARYR